MLTWREFSELAWRVTCRKREQEFLFAQVTAMVHNVHCTHKSDMKTADVFMPSLHGRRLKQTKPIDWEYEANVMKQWFLGLGSVRNG